MKAGGCFFFVVVCLSGCESAFSGRIDRGPAIPADRVAELASKARESGGVLGTFEILVRAAEAGVGAERGRVILYSESDYRSPRCVAVVLLPNVVKELFRNFQVEPVVDLKGKVIRVYGVAQKARVRFSVGGVPTSRAYVPAEIQISDVAKIHIVEFPKPNKAPEPTSTSVTPRAIE
jgi:hypothetical protein